MLWAGVCLAATSKEQDPRTTDLREGNDPRHPAQERSVIGVQRFPSLQADLRVLSGASLRQPEVAFQQVLRGMGGRHKAPEDEAEQELWHQGNRY